MCIRGTAKFKYFGHSEKERLTSALDENHVCVQFVHRHDFPYNCIFI